MTTLPSVPYHLETPASTRSQQSQSNCQTVVVGGEAIAPALTTFATLPVNAPTSPSVSQDLSSSVSFLNSNSRPTVIAAAKIFARSDIAQTASLLEKARLTEDRDFAEAFDIRTNAAGNEFLPLHLQNDWNGVTTIYKFETLRKRVGGTHRINLTLLKEYLIDEGAASSRGIIIKSKSLHCFRRMGLTRNIEYFDRENNQWRLANDGDLTNLKLQPNDRIVLLGNELPAPPAISTYHGTPTPFGPDQDGFFYHERQVGALCGIHAINSLLGYSAVTTRDAKDQLCLDLDASPYQTSVFLDPDDGVSATTISALVNARRPSGANPYKVVEIKKKAIPELQPRETPWPQEATNLVNAIPASVDRIIVGYVDTLGHYLTLRKHPTTGIWHSIDSQSPNQEKFRTLEEAILFSQRGREQSPGRDVFLIYSKDE